MTSVAHDGEALALCSPRVQLKALPGCSHVPCLAVLLVWMFSGMFPRCLQFAVPAEAQTLLSLQAAQVRPTHAGPSTGYQATSATHRGCIATSEGVAAFGGGEIFKGASPLPCKFVWIGGESAMYRRSGLIGLSI